MVKEDGKEVERSGGIWQTLKTELKKQLHLSKDFKKFTFLSHIQMRIRKNSNIYSSDPQTFWHQGLVSCMTIFPQTRVAGDGLGMIQAHYIQAHLPLCGLAPNHSLTSPVRSPEIGDPWSIGSFVRIMPDTQTLTIIII